MDSMCRSKGTAKGRSVTARAALGLALAGLGLAACAPVPPPVLLGPLSPADQAHMAEATRQALDAQNDGQALNWENPAGGSAGTVLPLRSFESGLGIPCRDFQQTITIAGLTRIAYGTACRQDDRDWRLVRPPGVY